MAEDENEIGAAELMARIQREAARAAADLRQYASDFDFLNEPSDGVVPGPSADHLPPANFPAERLRQMLKVAREKIDVPSWAPKFSHRMLRKQGGFDRAILEAVRLLLRANEQLHKQASEVSDYLEVQNRWLEGLTAERVRNQAWMSAAKEELVKLRQDLAQLKQGGAESLGEAQPRSRGETVSPNE